MQAGPGPGPETFKVTTWFSLNAIILNIKFDIIITHLTVLKVHSWEGLARWKSKLGLVKYAAVCSDTQVQSIDHNTITLWSATSPSVIVNLQWNPWAALASVILEGDDSMRNWQDWIFSEEQTATLEQWAGQRAPISSVNNSCWLIHQTPSELSLHSTLQGLHQSPASCYFVPFTYTVSPVHPQNSVFGLFHAYCLCWSVSLGSWVFWTKRQQTRSWLVTFSSTIKDKHQRLVFGQRDVRIRHVCMSICWHQCF